MRCHHHVAGAFASFRSGITFLCELTCDSAQHARPYRALVHDLVGLQRNVSNVPEFVELMVMLRQVVALEEPRMGSKEWSVVQACAS